MRLVTVMALLVGVTVGLAAAPSAKAEGRYHCWVSHGHRHCVLAREGRHVWRAKSVRHHPVPHVRYARAEVHYGLYVEPEHEGRYHCWVSHGHRHCVLAREGYHVRRAKWVRHEPVPHWRYARAQLHYGLYVEPDIYGKRLSEHELHLVRAITFRPHCWLPGRQACGTGAAMWNAVMGFGGTAAPHPFGWAPN